MRCVRSKNNTISKSYCFSFIFILFVETKIWLHRPIATPSIDVRFISFVFEEYIVRRDSDAVAARGYAVRHDNDDDFLRIPFLDLNLKF